MRALVLLFAVLAAPLAAQTAYVRVDAAAGQVLVDGTLAGAPGAWIAVAPGDRTVTLVDDARAFDPRRADEALTLAAGDSVALALALPARVRVESLPIRALVVRETAAGPDTLGTTPLTLEAPPGETFDLRATHAGYESVRRTVAAGDGDVTLVLPLGAATVPDVALLPTQRSTRGRTLVDLAIGAGTLAAGAAAVYYKFQADALDDRYRTEGTADYRDESLREEAMRLDRVSATALGAMQIGVGVLAIRFVLR